jgi:transcriptional regulator with XRE-family HTH domain
MEDSVIVHIARRVTKLRLSRGLSQEDLASRADLPLERIVGIEHAERWPSADELSRLATALDVMPTAFFADEGSGMSERAPGFAETVAGYAQPGEIVRLVSAFDSIAETQGRASVIALAETLASGKSH